MKKLHLLALLSLSIAVFAATVSGDYHGIGIGNGNGNGNGAEPEQESGDQVIVYPLNAGWAWSDWFGVVYTEHEPWVFHLQNGWHYVVEGEGDAVWLYSLDLEWLFSNRMTYPYMWSYARESWLYYLKGTAAPRFFWDFGEEEWISLPRVQHPTLRRFYAELSATQEIPHPNLTDAGAIGSGIRFETGRGAYAEAEDHEELDITGSMTISFWLNIMDGFRSEWDSLVAKGDDTYQVRRALNSDNIRFDVRGGDGGNVSLTSEFEMPLHTWVHVVAVYDADAEEMRFYFNGEQDANTSSRSGSLGVNEHGLTLGANFSGTEYRRFSNVKLDEVAIFDRALSTTDVVAHHAAGMAIAYADLVVLDNPVAYWRFEETSGTVVADEMGQHPLVLVNGPRLHTANPRGSAEFSLDVSSRELSWGIVWEGLTGAATGMHLHGPAAIGETAGVRVNIGGMSGLVSPSAGSTTLTEEQMEHLLSGQYYLNIHTSQNGPGEIRGQVVPVTTLSHQITLSPHQEVPFPVLNGATPEGSAYVVADPDEELLHWVIKADGYSSDPTNAHFHGPADFGTSAGVRQGIAGISGLESPMVGSVDLTREQFMELFDRLWYINIHTANNGPGEIRGQVHTFLFDGLKIAEVALTTDEEVPTPTLNGATPSGGATVVYEPSTRTLSWVVQYRGMTSDVTGAHFHGSARPGETAGVVVNIGGLSGGLDSPMVGYTMISEELEAALLGGLLYINVHTTQNGAGEIRGQVVFR